MKKCSDWKTVYKIHLKSVKFMKVKECLCHCVGLEKTKGMLILDQKKDISVTSVNI